MATIFTIIGLYFAVIIIIGFISRRRQKKTAEDFFLARRTIGSFVMTLSVFASLISAFIFTGLPGMVYKTGAGYLASLPVSNFFFVVMIFLIGYKVWMAGRKLHLITPTELFKYRFQSPGLGIIIFIVMVIFVLPYIALQPIGGGYLLSSITGGKVSYEAGAALITLVVIIYSFVGGFRGIAWIDALQGVIFLVIMVATLMFIALAVGGFQAGSARIAAELPALFSVSGPVNMWTWPMCFSWVVFIGLNIIFQPHIFSRYYSGKSARTIQWSFATWPILVAIVHLPIIFIGLYGRLLLPKLPQPDSLVPIFWVKFTPHWFAGLGAAAMLSALMSTISGQLMVFSSMWTRDIYVPYINPKATETRQFWMGRIAIVVLALLGLAVAYKPPALMGILAASGFSGIAVLAPAGFAAFYWPRATRPAVIASVIGGEIPVIVTYFNWVPKTFWLGFDASIPGLIIGIILLVVISQFTKAPSRETVDGFISPDMGIFKYVRG
jgi:SSS family solute:Na+ symporter